MKFICYERCSTCKSVEKMMKAKNIDYEFRSIKSNNPTKEEIKEFHEKSGLDIKKLFNTSGKIYREKNLKDKLDEMSLDEKYELLSTDGMLVKRPIIVDADKVYIGPLAKKFIESI